MNFEVILNWTKNRFITLTLLGDTITSALFPPPLNPKIANPGKEKINDQPRVPEDDGRWALTSDADADVERQVPTQYMLRCLACGCFNLCDISSRRITGNFAIQEAFYFFDRSRQCQRLTVMERDTVNYLRGTCQIPTPPWCLGTLRGMIIHISLFTKYDILISLFFAARRKRKANPLNWADA